MRKRKVKARAAEAATRTSGHLIPSSHEGRAARARRKRGRPARSRAAGNRSHPCSAGPWHEASGMDLPAGGNAPSGVVWPPAKVRCQLPGTFSLLSEYILRVKRSARFFLRSPGASRWRCGRSGVRERFPDRLADSARVMLRILWESGGSFASLSQPLLKSSVPAGTTATQYLNSRA